MITLIIRLAVSVALLAPALFAAACQSAGRSESTNAADPATIARNQGYALLYSTISDESDVDKVLIIKRTAPEVAELIKAIGQFSRDSKNTLQQLAKQDPALMLENQGLPKAETRARDSISSATSKKILLSSGKELEFRLLLTQHEALNYITHLAGALGEQEPRENRKRYLAHLVKEAAALHDKALAQLGAPYVGPSK